MVLNNYELHNQRSRNESNLSIREDKVKIKVDDEIIFKEGDTGSRRHYFIIKVYNSIKKQISRVEKTYQDFKAFTANLEYNLREKGIRPPKLNSNGMFDTLMASSDEMFKNLDYHMEDEGLNVEDQLRDVIRFCKEIAKDPDYYTSEFYFFFNIPSEFQAPDNCIDMQSSVASVHRPSEIRLSTTSGQNIRNSKGDTLKWINFQLEDTINYCQYFIISLEKFAQAVGDKGKTYFLFTFKVRSPIDPDMVYLIDKRYSDFDKFYEKFKKETKARCPPLPGKTLLINTHQNLEHRGLSLTEWLLLVSNEKMFHNNTFFEFIGLPKSSFNRYLTINPIAYLYKTMDFDIRIKSTEKVNSVDLDDKFTLYGIAVTISNSEMKNQVSGYMIKRRYREFHKLHEILSKKFAKYKKPLPELPQKKYFKKKSVSRQYKLENYLKLLMDYPDILDCLAFRKFLLLNPQKFNEFKVEYGSYLMQSVMDSRFQQGLIRMEDEYGRVSEHGDSTQKNSLGSQDKKKKKVGGTFQTNLDDL